MSSRKRRLSSIMTVAGLTASALTQSSFAATQVTGIDFRGTADPGEITISANGPLVFERNDNTQDKQIVLELKDATLSKGASRKIDTSSFPGNVTLISPYQVEGQPNTVRVVIQLREQADADVTSEGNLLKVTVPREGGATSSAASSAPAPEEIPSGTQASSSTAEESASDEVAMAAPNAASNRPKSNLDQFMETRESKRFTGKPITLQVRDADAVDVFRLIGEASGFNIVLGDDVKGKITLSLVDVPWDQALDLLLRTLQLGAERNNNILRIATLKNLAAEKTEELNATRAAQASAPRITRIFPISYANLTDLQATLTKFASSLGGNSSGQDANAVVQIDNRTNSLIVRDLPQNLERMKKLIEFLDTQTPQVMIEAKIIEATEDFGKQISGNIGLSSSISGSNMFASFAGINPIDPLVGSPGIFAEGKDIVDQLKSNTGFGFSPNLSFLPGQSRLTALLSIGEQESKLKVISSPKTVVMNKEEAKIIQTIPVLVPAVVASSTGVQTSVALQDAVLSLTVKPTVTNDGSVLMKLEVSRDVPLPAAGATQGGNQTGVSKRNMVTQVLVDSGSTLVIGGIYSMTNTRTSSGFPFLRKIPIIGALFGEDRETGSRTELFFFVTPRILNLKEAGLSG